jgi:hypothetical protein
VTDTERTQATVSPEAWAAAQVEEVAKGLEKKAKREKQAPPRGVFFRARANGEVIGPKGQRGEWWVLWYDGDGGRHREKAGTKAAALARGSLTRRIVREISLTYHVKMSDFQPIDGG